MSRALNFRSRCRAASRRSATARRRWMKRSKNTSPRCPHRPQAPRKAAD